MMGSMRRREARTVKRSLAGEVEAPSTLSAFSLHWVDPLDEARICKVKG